MRVTYLDINEMFFTISNDLDSTFIFLLAERVKLAFFLPVVEGPNDDLGSP